MAWNKRLFENIPLLVQPGSKFVGGESESEEEAEGSETKVGVSRPKLL